VNRRTGLAAFLCCAAVTLGGAVQAPAHQTAYSKGVAVTLHVTPDDEPVAGKQARILVTEVDPPRRGKFSWKSCACYLRVSDSSGRVVLNRRAGKRTSFKFPRTGAYEIVFSGRYKRDGRTKRFRTTYAIRAY
jgi:hypothetical protein